MLNLQGHARTRVEQQLRLLLADGFLIDTVSLASLTGGPGRVEVGPRLNFATAWSSNLVSICQAMGLDCVTRVERSRRYLVPEGEDLQAFIDARHDRMTECPYPAPLDTFRNRHCPGTGLRGGPDEQGTGWPAGHPRHFDGRVGPRTLLRYFVNDATAIRPLSKSWISTMPTPSIRAMAFSGASRSSTARNAKKPCSRWSPIRSKPIPKAAR